MTRSGNNRPFKYGSRDRREFIVEDVEVAMQMENDANGNPIYVGRAKVGTATSDTKWQIRFITYDGNESPTSVEWPQNDEGNPSGEYEFSWDARAGYSYA